MNTTAEAHCRKIVRKMDRPPGMPIMEALTEAYEAGVRDTMAARGKSPHPPGRCPFGFWAAEKPTLELMLKWRQEGCSVEGISAALNAEELYRRHGSRWTRQAVGRVLAAQTTAVPPA